jgi:iron-sulfur cluster insertion protein
LMLGKIGAERRGTGLLSAKLKQRRSTSDLWSWSMPNVHLSNSAVAKLKQYADEAGMQPQVRLKVQGGGCSGLQSDMYLEEIVNADFDELLEQDGIKIVIDQMSIHYLEGCVIDYVEGEFMSGFQFRFPDQNATSCGCGSSWSV